MRYTFMLYSNENDFAAEPHAVMPHTAMPHTAMQESLQAFRAYIEALQAAGVLVDTDWLKPTSTATTLTLRNGSRQIHEGPFARTREQLGGYFVIEVGDLDQALSWAAKCPAAHYGSVEIRASAMPAVSS